MAYNEKLAARIREALSHLPKVKEKKMSRGVTFMVNNRTCVGVNGDNLMVSFDPSLQKELSEKNGFEKMKMEDRIYEGYCYVHPDGIKSEDNFEFWIHLALDYNKRARAAKRFLVFIVFVTVVVTGIFIWFSSYHNHNNDFTIPFILSVVFVLGFSILSRLQIMKIVFASTIGVEIALIIKIIIDWQFDPTSHNLFPFEIMIDLITVLIASLIGAGIGLIYRNIIKRKSVDKK